MACQKVNRLKDDKQLHQDGKNRAYARQQGHLDSFEKVCNIAIYIIPILLLGWLLIMVIRNILINNWHPIESGGQAIFLYIFGYFSRYLQTMGINNAED
jgi:hypothetical protein